MKYSHIGINVILQIGCKMYLKDHTLEECLVPEGQADSYHPTHGVTWAEQLLGCSKNQQEP